MDYKWVPSRRAATALSTCQSLTMAWAVMRGLELPDEYQRLS